MQLPPASYVTSLQVVTRDSNPLLDRYTFRLINYITYIIQSWLLLSYSSSVLYYRVITELGSS